MDKPIRYLSVCSGMEAATVAWHHMGWTPVGFAEIEPFPCAILKHHYPTIPNYGDITKYKQWPIERGSIDLLVGGTPCQAFSVAGLRKGLDDPRGNLALTFLGLADKLRPKYILWENVPGVLSSNKGRDFGSFIGALAELGYGFAWRVCDAQFYGVPQRRKRVFLLAVEGAGNWRTSAEILFEPEGLRGDFETGNKKRKKSSTDAGEGVEGQGILWSSSDQPNAERLIDKSGTLNCNKGQRGGYIIPIQDGREIDKSQNGLGIAKEGDPSYTIDTTGSQSVAVPFRKSKRACSKTDNETWVEDTGGGNIPLVNGEPVKPLMFKVRGGSPVETGEQGGTPGKAAGKGYLGSEDKAFTVASTQDQWLAEPITFQVGNLIRKAGADPSTEATTTLKATSGDQTPCVAIPMAFDAYNQTVSETSQTLSCSATDVNHTGAVFSPTMAVRRLTPKECERLQGFPDNWSQIPWKGKPAEQCPDGPRYKACGNSMAVPVMRWIGERIQKHIDGTLNK
jgi:DNA (cytosine-5)-methyltransferase 1